MIMVMMIIKSHIYGVLTIFQTLFSALYMLLSHLMPTVSL